MADTPNHPDASESDADRIGHLLASLERSDLQLFEPPTDLWDRIEAATKSGRTSNLKRPPSRLTGSYESVEYWIDANDVVVGVGSGWNDFARANDAPELAVPPAHRTLWSYFDTEQTRELWQMVVARVRTLQKPAQVPLRCDAPDARRWIEIEITPESEGRVHFRSTIVFEEHRPPVTLLDSHSERDRQLDPLLMCTWCGRVQHDSAWLDVDDLVTTTRLFESTLPPLSHGICEPCRDDMSAELLVPDLRNNRRPD